MYSADPLTQISKSNFFSQILKTLDHFSLIFTRFVHQKVQNYAKTFLYIKAPKLKTKLDFIIWTCQKCVQYRAHVMYILFQKMIKVIYNLRLT